MEKYSRHTVLCQWFRSVENTMLVCLVFIYSHGFICVLLKSQCSHSSYPLSLTHWGRVTHICVSKLSIIGSDNGLSPDRRQAIIWTNAGILLIGPLGTNFSEISIEILTFSFKKMRLKVSSAKRWPFCLGLNVLINTIDRTQARLVWLHLCIS